MPALRSQVYEGCASLPARASTSLSRARSKTWMAGQRGALWPGHDDVDRSRILQAGINPHDPQAQVRRLPPLFTQARPEDRPAAQPRHLQDPRGGREARARGPVLQAARVDRFHETDQGKGIPCSRRKIPCSREKIPCSFGNREFACNALKLPKDSRFREEQGIRRQRIEMTTEIGVRKRRKTRESAKIPC
jgi:hypothetical protein